LHRQVVPGGASQLPSDEFLQLLPRLAISLRNHRQSILNQLLEHRVQPRTREYQHRTEKILFVVR